jgi:hypothetical protein
MRGVMKRCPPLWRLVRMGREECGESYLAPHSRSCLLRGHNYLAQTNADVAFVNWSNADGFVTTQTADSFTEALNASSLFWRIHVP